MRAEFHRRRSALRRLLSDARADALIVTHAPNVFYLTGFTGSAGVAVVSARHTTLYTDSRYTVQAAAEAKSAGVEVEIAKGNLLAAAGGSVGAKRRVKVVFDPTRTTVAALRTLEHAGGKAVVWQAESGWIEALREVKSEDEIQRMRAAACLGSKVVEEVVRLLRPGIREREVAAEIEFRMRKLGADGPSFETIVASGPRSALPHARPTDRKLRRNELVVLDLGAILARYCSDLTRTVFIGRAPKRVKEWYRAVLEAQQAAKCILGPGIECSQADSEARKVLAGYGLAQYFTHSLGHGLGLEVHEDPRLASGQTRKLQPGNVVTVEPGIYIEGFGGIRIEDDVLIKKTGVEMMTTANRELVEI